MRRLILLSGFSVLMACGPSPSPAPIMVIPQAPIAARDDGPSLDPAAPLVLPDSDRAPWREYGVAAPREAFRSDKPTLTSAGVHAALFKTRWGQSFAVHEERGAIGPLAIPIEPLLWAAIDEGDRIFAASLTGDLWVAQSLEGAKNPSAFQKINNVGAATAWDLAPGMIVAAHGAEVLVSTNGGQSFAHTVPRKGVTIAKVFARYDGAIVAVSGEPGAGAKAKIEVFVSPNHGKSWSLSPQAPAGVQRNGALIWDGSYACPTVLAKDGRSWTLSEDMQADRWVREGKWDRAFDVGDRPISQQGGKRIRIDEPAPPSKIVSPAACKKGLANMYGVGGLGLKGGGQWGGIAGRILGGVIGGCKGVACLAGSHGPKPEETRTKGEFLHDGVCGVASQRGGACSAFTQPPHLAILDRSVGRATLAEMPEGCAPKVLYTGGGLSVLVCARRSEMLAAAAQADGSLAIEGTFPADPEDVVATTMSSDGTLGFHLACASGSSCRFVVRSPSAAGQGNYRMIAVPGAIAYRVAGAGAAAAIVPEGPDALAPFSIVLATLDGQLKKIARHVEQDRGEVAFIGFAIEEGRVVIERKAHQGVTKLVVTNGGILSAMATAASP